MKQGTAIGALVAVFVIALVAVIYAMGGFGQTGAVTDNGVVSPTERCDVTPSYTVKGYDINNKGTAITENFAYRKVGETSWSTGTLGTAITTLEAFAEYEAVAGIDASNGVDNPYGEAFTFTVPCKVGASMEVALYNDEVEGSVTGTFYNADGDASAETFIAGQTQDVSLKFQTGTDEAYGNPFLDNPNVLILKLNSSQWDQPEKVTLNGVELKSVSMPQRFDIEALGTTDFTEYAFEAPAIMDTTVEIVLKLNADDSNAPNVDGTAYLFAGTSFINEDAGISVDVETEEGADIGSSDPVSVTLDFTA
jgi:hypothetical protein